VCLVDGTTVGIMDVYHDASDVDGVNARLDTETDGDEVYVNGAIVDPSEDGQYSGEYDQNWFGLTEVEEDECYGYSLEDFAKHMDHASFHETGRHCQSFLENAIKERIEFEING